ncbi:MAG: hypothetical protein HY866_01755 [Chloroflexi bacterium]|nr:hypothetical protein [Chloroflexota bacterium]
MGHSKVRHRKKQRSLFKQNFWLPVVVVGALLLVGVAAILSGQKNKNGTSSSGSDQFDPNFKPEVTGAPRVMVPQDYIDYGEVKLGTTVTTTFDVRNVGDQPLVILDEPQVELVEGC